MNAPTPRFSILLLTEDGAAQAHATLESLTRKILRHLDPHCDLKPAMLEIEPAAEAAQAVARANSWKDPTRRDLVWLRQYIATQLQGEFGFVIHHVDGDRPYARRGSSENVRKFDDMIRTPVGIILEGPPPMRRSRRVPPPPPPESAQERLAKLFLLAPFYSIEAWLFQNTTAAARLCRQNPKCAGECADLLASWQADRGLLDEVEKPKKKLCFKDQHNATLAGAGLPIEPIIAARKSLHDSILPMRDCTALTRALARTHQPPPSP